MSAERVAKITAKMNALNPDIILLAGDYVNGHTRAAERTDVFNKEIEAGLINLGGLKAPLGVYATLGNHDAWYSNPRLIAGLQAGGITVLNDQHMIVSNQNADICIVGMADYWTGKPERSMFGLCDAEQYGARQNIIAFTHSPDSFQFVPMHTALVLEGHTHGGQINLPLLGRRVTSTFVGKKYAYGKVQWNGIPGFVTAGIGTSILPARFRAPPEIVIITLSAR